MKPPEDATIVQRIVTTFFIVILVLLLLAVIGWATGGWDEAQGEQMRTEPHLVLTLPPSKWDDKLLQLDRQALDEAYLKKIEQLFSVWVSDDTGQPERAVKGAAQAKRAYIEAQRALDMREQMMFDRDKEQPK